ncbi:flavoprotein [Streptomyces coeruleorubidus]|uniref:flavoprotein n=1 Tax=Streptomyces coeruleorubidus TaxID=116188 RepID=UPI00237F8897|nr:flavoprotein [Streptomyces coeruleorubidus]WDV51840.1 flavoprotein [Streptomyces coeruleorubidus]
MTGAAGAVEPVGVRRLLVVGTGSVTAAHLPFWASWLKVGHPGTQVRYVLTGAATRFVTREALVAIGGCEVLADRWPDEPEPRARHVDLAQWPDAVVVFPATLNYLARLALGLGDSPSLLALQCTRAAIALAPALPPGGTQSAAYADHTAKLRARRNVVVVPPHPGRSTTSGKREAWAPASFPDLLAAADRLRAAPEAPALDGHDGPEPLGGPNGPEPEHLST